MKVNIICVGKIKESFFNDAIAEYKKRLSRFCNFSIIEVDEDSKQTNISIKSEKESKMLLEKWKGAIVALDGKGKMLSSEDLAEYIEKKEISGISEISFVIGGSNGLSKTILDSADIVVSFGKITYPHQLFRVVLSEQIYRAFTIIKGLPYHK